jgi:type II secretory pathway pseudopilin PulG
MLNSKLGIATIVTAILCMQGIQASENPQRAEFKTNHRLSVEAISNLGTLNRAQQSYQLENGRFASKIDQLDARISGKFYSYTIVAANKGQVITRAIPKSKGLKPVVAGVAIRGESTNSSTNEFYQIICESKSPGFSVSSPKFDGAKWVCGAGSQSIE